MGALTATGLTPLREPFEPLTPGRAPRAQHELLSLERGPRSAVGRRAIEEAIVFEGPETVAAVILEPVQNGGGCFVPQDGYFQRVREICDRHGVLLISDEVICSWGRLGHWFGCERYGYEPDMITTAKGITSAYAPMGAVIASDRLPSRSCTAPRSSTTASRSAGTRWLRGCAGQHRRDRARGPLRARARERGRFRAMLEGLRDLPIVGDVRGAGYFHAIELVKDKETKETFNARGVRGAAARLPLGRALRARADLPHRRPRRSRGPALAAADRGRGAVRGDRGDPAPGADRGLGADREQWS